MTTSVWVNAQTILPGDYLVEAETTVRWVRLWPESVEVTRADGTVRVHRADSAVLVRRANGRH